MKSIIAVAALFVISCTLCSHAFYSVNFYTANEEHDIVNSGSFFKEAPSAVQVADICARISGFNPILRNGKIKIYILI